MTLSDEEQRLLADLGAAERLAENGDRQGVRTMEEMAAKGSTTAMAMLAHTFSAGPFVDLPMAERWYRILPRPVSLLAKTRRGGRRNIY